MMSQDQRRVIVGTMTRVCLEDLYLNPSRLTYLSAVPEKGGIEDRTEMNLQ